MRLIKHSNKNHGYNQTKKIKKIKNKFLMLKNILKKYSPKRNYNNGLKYENNFIEEEIISIKESPKKTK